MSLTVPSKSTYHFYNQGNNKRPIFLDSMDYLHFLKLYRKYVHDHCDLLAWCLMPNHFHLMLILKESGEQIIKIGPLELTLFSNGVRLLQCQYSQYFNRKYFTSGSLFRQKAKIKCCDEMKGDYRILLFNYIHYNPVQSGLVNAMKDWDFSSFKDYHFNRGGTLVNSEITAFYLGFELSESFF